VAVIVSIKLNIGVNYRINMSYRDSGLAGNLLIEQTTDLNSSIVIDIDQPSGEKMVELKQLSPIFLYHNLMEI
jgi:hypothetical protein